MTATPETIFEDSARYHTDIEVLDETSHYGRIAKLVGQGKHVLELGCSTGFFSRALVEQFGCTVVGVELDASAAQEAKKYCKQVIVGDLDQADLLKPFHDGVFDVVVCSDVLEHLRDPSQILKALKRVLKPDGCIVASIPHVGHGSVRLSLLSGQFPYRSMGLLDHTHLRFFDRIGLEQLFDSTGYDLVEVHRNRWSMLDSEVGSRLGNFPPELLEALNTDAEADTYQFIVKARPQARKITANASIEFVVFETLNQPINDRIVEYLSGLNYAGLKMQFHLIRLNGTRESHFELPVEKFEFGSHDFRTFRFARSGDVDGQWSVPVQKPNSVLLDKQAILKDLASKLTGEFVFVTDSQNLPTTDCLQRLVEFARSDANYAVAAATPEVRKSDSTYKTGGGDIVAVPLTCVLYRRKNDGGKTAQVEAAHFFTFGVGSWEQANSKGDLARIAIGFVKKAMLKLGLR